MVTKRIRMDRFSGVLTGHSGTQAANVVANAIFSLLIGFAASRAEIFDGMAPFGIAAVTAVSRTDGLLMLLGSLIGYLLPAGPDNPLRYIAATGAAYIFCMLFSGFERLAKSAVYPPAVSAGACLLTGAAVLAANGFTATDATLLLAETAICGCSAALFKEALPLLRQPSSLVGLKRRQLVCVTAVLYVLLLAFSPVALSGVSSGRLLAVLTILIAARYGGEAGGCIAGACAFLAMGMGDRSMVGALAGYAVGGLAAGLFSPLGRFACTAAFVLANAVPLFAVGATSQVVACLYEAAGASVLFLLLPEKLLCRFSAVLATPHESSSASREALSQRLFSAAGALSDVSDTVSQVGEKLHKMKKEDISCVYTDAAEITCTRCGMRMYCWGTAYNDTMNALDDMTGALKKNGKLDREDVPQHFAGRCCRLGELLGSVNRSFAEYTARSMAKRQIAQLRGLLVEEFSGISAFLRDLGGELSAGRHLETGSDAARTALRTCGLSVESAVCTLDNKGRMTVEADIFSMGPEKINRQALARELSETCGRRFAEPTVSGHGAALSLQFVQKPALRVKFAQTFLQKDGETLCGDAAEAFTDGSGRALMLLSDGMGCGGSAAVDANLTIELMSRLLRSGFDFEPALRVVNSAMMLKSGDESFATLDIVSLDLFSGEAEFLKAGAPACYIRRCGRAERVMQSSMPLGILRGVRLERAHAQMRKGDLILLVSDGMVPESDAWLMRALEKYDDEDPETFVKALTKHAHDARSDGHEDDITALMAVIE